MKNYTTAYFSKMNLDVHFCDPIKEGETHTKKLCVGFSMMPNFNPLDIHPHLHGFKIQGLKIEISFNQTFADNLDLHARCMKHRKYVANVPFAARCPCQPMVGTATQSEKKAAREEWETRAVKRAREVDDEDSDFFD